MGPNMKSAMYLMAFTLIAMTLGAMLANAILEAALNSCVQTEVGPLRPAASEDEISEFRIQLHEARMATRPATSGQ